MVFFRRLLLWFLNFLLLLGEFRGNLVTHFLEEQGLFIRRLSLLRGLNHEPSVIRLLLLPIPRQHRGISLLNSLRELLTLLLPYFPLLFRCFFEHSFSFLPKPTPIEFEFPFLHRPETHFLKPAFAYRDFPLHLILNPIEEIIYLIPFR